MEDYRTNHRSGGLVGQVRTPDHAQQEKIVAQQEVGSVHRELGKLEESVVTLSHVIDAHIMRIEAVVLDQPGTSQGNGPMAPDANVCGVAGGVRMLRRRIEEATATLARITERVDI